MSDAFCLAIETSGRTASVALGPGPDDVRVRAVPRTRRHNLALLPTIDALCRERGVGRAALRGGAVFVSLGPGSFTGLRVGVSAAQMLGLALGCELVGVPTIEALARNVPADRGGEPVAVCLASRRGRAYAAVYRGGEAVTPASHVALAAMLAATAQPRPTAVLGESVARQIAEHAEAAAQGVTVLDESLAEVRAAVVFELGWSRWRGGQTTLPARLLPLYGREPEAVRLWAARHAEGEARPAG